MIQLSAFPAATGPAIIAEILGNGGAEAGEAGDFSALLAVRLGTEPALPAPATAAIPALALPDTGKILPPVLQEVIAEVLPSTLAHAVPARVNAAADSESDPAPVTGPEPTTAKPSRLTLPCTIVAKANATPDTRSDPAPDAKAVDTVEAPPLLATIRLSPAPHDPAAQSAVPPVPVPAELVANALVPSLIQPVISRAEPTEAAARPFSRQFDQPVDQPPARTLPANVSALAPLPSPLPAIAALPALPIAFTSALHPASATPELPRLTDPLTRASMNLRIRAASADITAPITLTGKPGDGPTLVYEPLHGKAAQLREAPQIREAMASALTEAQPAGSVSTAPGPAPIRPLDFAALVDRLVQARDAAAPRSVSLALTHAEFGTISLRFEQDEAGLNVGMTSSDPEFARAVSAAMLPERAGLAERATLAEQQQGSSQGQSSPRDASSSDTPGQSRSGPNSERRDERGAPRPAPAQTSRDPADKPGRSEIFA